MWSGITSVKNKINNIVKKVRGERYQWNFLEQYVACYLSDIFVEYDGQYTEMMWYGNIEVYILQITILYSIYIACLTHARLDELNE